MKLKARIYRKAANELSNEINMGMGCCFYINEVGKYYETDNYENIPEVAKLKEIFAPNTEKMYWFGHKFTKHEQLHRALALDLMAEMLEQGDL